LRLPNFFFLVAAPEPYSTIQSIPILCVDKQQKPTSLKDPDAKPFEPRGDHACEYIKDFHDENVDRYQIEANDIVFSQWLPLPRDGVQLKMSRWFQTMNTVVDLQIVNNPNNPIRKYL
jgi:hypothetical protein